MGGPVTSRDNATGGLFSGPPAYVARTPWDPVRALFATLLIIGAGILGAALVVGSANIGRIGEPGREDMTALATLGAWQILAIVLTVLASGRRGGHARDVLSLQPPAGAPWVYLGALACMTGLQLLLSLVQYGVVAHDLLADLRPFARLATGQEWLIALLVVGIGAPLSEELLFRGFLVSALARSRLGFVGASLISTAGWTLLHAGYSAAGITEVFVIGLFFCWLLWRTGSLRVAIFCHALYNSLVVLVLRHVPLPA